MLFEKSSIRPTPAREVIAQKEESQLAAEIATLTQKLKEVETDPVAEQLKKDPVDTNASEFRHVVHHESETSRHWPGPGPLLK